MVLRDVRIRAALHLQPRDQVIKCGRGDVDARLRIVENATAVG
jgi:hypothetical protein